jgi:hypothetical protein
VVDSANAPATNPGGKNYLGRSFVIAFLIYLVPVYVFNNFNPNAKLDKITFGGSFTGVLCTFGLGLAFLIAAYLRASQDERNRGLRIFLLMWIAVFLFPAVWFTTLPLIPGFGK